MVLNLVISGIPSIPLARFTLALEPRCFKHCYKWNTFNTMDIKKWDSAKNG